MRVKPKIVPLTPELLELFQPRVGDNYGKEQLQVIACQRDDRYHAFAAYDPVDGVLGVGVLLVIHPGVAEVYVSFAEGVMSSPFDLTVRWLFAEINRRIDELFTSLGLHRIQARVEFGSEERKRWIEAAVKLIVKEYGPVLERLGNSAEKE